MFIISLGNQGHTLKGESPAISTLPSQSLSSKLQYIEPGYLPTTTALELKKDQKGDIPYIQSPSFSPTFPNKILINRECYNSNSKDRRWAKLHTLANTSLAAAAAADAAQKAAQCGKAQKQATLYNLMNKVACKAKEVTCKAKETAPVNVPVCQAPD